MQGQIKHQRIQKTGILKFYEFFDASDIKFNQIKYLIQSN